VKSAGQKWQKLGKKLRLSIVVAIVLAILGSTVYVILRETLLRNFQDLGTALAKSYASEESNNLTVYETLISFGTNSINDRILAGESPDSIEEWIGAYYERLQSVLGENTVDIYAVFQNRILAANPWEGDETFNLSGAEWYQNALQADGKVVFTDVYIDSIYQKPVVTIAQKCKNADAVLAFDIFPENFQVHTGTMPLPEGSSIYVCDREGTLLYEQTDLRRSREGLQSYLDSIVQGIRSGELEAYDASIEDLSGSQRGVYYHRMPNDWLVILTVPFDTILGQLNQFSLLFGMIMLLSFAGIGIMARRDLHLYSQVERTNETVRVLGNTYYALYRVDYQNEQYEMIKGSDYVRRRLPEKGPYADLLQAVGEVIETRTFKEFQDSFSSDNIRNLVSKRVRDYGGDFRRRFGEEYRWVNVRVLFDESLSPNEVVLCFREVEQEKQQQLQERELLEDALENARRSEKTKQAFFNNMSHDMRTPLNAILGLTDLAEQHRNEPERVGGYIEKIRFSGRQLLDLVNDILEMSRMEQGKMVLNNQSFDLKQCIEDCIAAFRLQAETEHKVFQIHYDVHCTKVLGDSLRLGQIMNNLISNAFKFTSEGDTISLIVKQFEESSCSKFQIVVKDTGIGMSEEFLPHLFEPYSRETTFSSRQISGTGLGMPIVKNLVTQKWGAQLYDRTYSPSIIWIRR
jgi:signal transduction histidine kinase